MSSEEPKKTPPAADSKPAPASSSSPPAKPAAAATKPAAASSSPPAKATPPPAPAAAPKPAAATPPPAKKEPEPPAFEKGLAQQLTTRFGDIVKIVYIRPLRIKVMVAPANIVEVATYIRDNMGFDHAESAGGTDYPKDKQIEVAYHLGSYTRDDLLAHILVLATRTDRDDARMPSLINVYKSVEYHERETFEMLGVYFEGHPRNERFLLPEDWADIPPLRKDFRIKGR
ncbi:NADH-quinone oxidoreductase subunit C [Nitrososphaera sp.]|uniref:NADH-quinone oxidoreductase subunit C n=1 Tax=Nitrososphaera sp. TaxID=1971748 RepID=UPI00307D70D0